jgi:heptaprenyl diphosphate synthase
MNSKTKKLTLLGVSTAAAMILSYIEFILPPLFSAVPGIKIGLANIIIVFLLYRLGAWEASLVSLVRLFLSALLFGSAVTLAYSAAGALFSMTVMVLLKKCGLFSTVGVSIAGGVFHNLGQIVMAIIILTTKEIGYYMIVLTATGILAGIFVGIVGALMLKYIKKI